jgi:hypothetical protein
VGANGDGEPEPVEPARGGEAMLRDEPGAEPVAGQDDDGGEGGAERRRAYRRQLPFGRGAVLVVGDRTHIVGIADLSVTGAYLRMRLALKVGDVHLLKILVTLPERTELRLRARVVRVSLAQDEGSHHTRGVAVHFVDVDPPARARLEAFVAQGR